MIKVLDTSKTLGKTVGDILDIAWRHLDYWQGDGAETIQFEFNGFLVTLKMEKMVKVDVD